MKNNLIVIHNYTIIVINVLGNLMINNLITSESSDSMTSVCKHNIQVVICLIEAR